MCDPITLIAGAATAFGGLIGGKPKAPPPPALPAPPPAPKEREVDILLGDDRPDDVLGSNEDEVKKKTGSSGIKAPSRKTGVQIV